MILNIPPSSCFLPAGFKSTKRDLLLPNGISTRRRVSTCPVAPWWRFWLSSRELASSDDSFTKYSGYLFEGGNPEAESLYEYDIAKIGAIYRRKPFLVARRLFQIGTSLGRWFGLRYIDGLLERSDEMFKIRAEELRGILVQLGPAFIKIAQAVSSRPDVIPPTYLEELSLLQDRIAPFSTEVAFNMIEKELGLPIDMVFSEITLEPVAAASLGQVYKARLCSSGQIVAVKVQRPGVQAAISLDSFILRYLAGFLQRAAKLDTDLQAVLDEWASSLFREMDYRAEAKNGLKFRELYGSLQDVFVPQMHLKLCSRRVLVMEWVEGKKLPEVKDLYMVEVGVYCSVSQFLEYGFYHADPHPGNVLRTNDRKLAYLDFGMMGEFRQELREGFMEACLHLVNRDFDAMAKDFVTLGLLPPTAQKAEVTKALTGVFKNAVSRGVPNISFRDLLVNLGLTMYKFKFRIPSYFTLVIRSLAVLEGIAISFDPNYKVLGSSYPWIARIVLTDSSPHLRSTLQTLLYKGGVFRIDRLESLLMQSLRANIKQSSLRTTTADKDSRMVIKQLLTFTLTEKGEFVREILLEELVKGMDALNIVALTSITSPLPIARLALEDEDIVNLRTLRRLLLLLSGLQKNQPPSPEVKIARTGERYLENASLVLYQAASVEEFLPVLFVIPELPLESREQLVRLPADLAGKLASRAIARTIRRIFL